MELDVAYYSTCLNNTHHYYELVRDNGKITHVVIYTKYKKLNLCDVSTKKLLGISSNTLYCQKLYLCTSISGQFEAFEISEPETKFIKSKISSLYQNELNKYSHMVKKLICAIETEQKRIDDEICELQKEKIKSLVKKTTKIDVDKILHRDYREIKTIENKNFVF